MVNSDSVFIASYFFLLMVVTLACYFLQPNRRFQCFYSECVHVSDALDQADMHAHRCFILYCMYSFVKQATCNPKASLHSEMSLSLLVFLTRTWKPLLYTRLHTTLSASVTLLITPPPSPLDALPSFHIRT